MLDYSKKISILFLTVLLLMVVLFFGKIGRVENYFAQASLWDMITAWVTINPLGVQVSAPAEVEIDKVFKVEARVINKGEEKIENAKGEIFLPLELVLIQKDSVKEIGVIPGKREKKIAWQVRGEKEGDYVVSVKASGELKEEIVSAEWSGVVKIKESVRRGGVQQWFKNFLDFFREQFRF